MWKWLEKKLFRRLEMRLAVELDGQRERLTREIRENAAVGRANIVHAVDRLDRLLDYARGLERQNGEILAFARMAADVTKATVAAEHAARLEQLSTNISQVIALQFGKTPNVLPAVQAQRPPREFDSDRRQ